jgi:hypothetical protein
MEALSLKFLPALITKIISAIISLMSPTAGVLRPLLRP